MPFVNMTLVPQDVVFLPTTSSCKSFFPNIEDGNENVSESGFIGICWQKSKLTKWIPIRCMAISPADNNASSGLASRKMSPAHILHFFFLLFYFLVFSSSWLHILGIFLDSPPDNLIKGIPPHSDNNASSGLIAFAESVPIPRSFFFFLRFQSWHQKWE